MTYNSPFNVLLIVSTTDNFNSFYWLSDIDEKLIARFAKLNFHYTSEDDSEDAAFINFLCCNNWNAVMKAETMKRTQLKGEDFLKSDKPIKIINYYKLSETYDTFDK